MSFKKKFNQEPANPDDEEPCSLSLGRVGSLRIAEDVVTEMMLPASQ